MNNNILDALVPERLSVEHKVSDFDCGVSSLNNFLKNDALTHQRQRISFTSVYLYQDVIVGYITLANDAISLELDTPAVNDLDTRYPLIPALKICRIGRDLKFRGNGIGNHMLEDAIAYAYSLNQSNILGTGCRFVTADVRDITLLTNFYYPNNFEYHNESEDKHRKIIHIRYDLGASD